MIMSWTWIILFLSKINLVLTSHYNSTQKNHFVEVRLFYIFNIRSSIQSTSFVKYYTKVKKQDFFFPDSFTEINYICLCPEYLMLWLGHCKHHQQESYLNELIDYEDIATRLNTISSVKSLWVISTLWP